MTKLDKIEESVAALSDEELKQPAVWLPISSGASGSTA